MKVFLPIALVIPAAAFVAPGHGRNTFNQRAVTSPEEAETDVESASRPIYDPMGLYPESSEEKQQGRIRAMEPKLEVKKPAADPMGLYPKDSPEFQESLQAEKESITGKDRRIFDPLGLYPKSSSEREEGKIEPLESEVYAINPVVDPMGLYSPTKAASEVDQDVLMSKALPFSTRPAALDGELAGDVGFDPLGFAKSRDDLIFLREAEIRHSRLAMLVSFD
jgi:hypothetical protein